MMTTITQLKKTGLGKALMLLWGFSLFTLIGFSLLGLLQHEFSGYLAFGFLVSSVLLNLSIIISYKVESGSLHIAKAGWAGLGVMILGSALYLFDGKPNSDIAIFLGWAMLVHSFPVGWIVSLLFASISYLLYSLFSIDLKVGYLYLSVIWLIFFAAGYSQWFKLLPSLIVKFRRK